VLTLRGLTREDLTALVLGSREAPPPPEPEPLPVEPQDFWQSAADPPPAGSYRAPALDAALVLRLGAFPFWRGQTSLAAALAPLYRQATRAARTDEQTE